jgi:hypothetical protein
MLWKRSFSAPNDLEGSGAVAGSSQRGSSPRAFARWMPWMRSWALAFLMAGAIVLILTQVHRHYPVQHWLFWRYAAYWGAMGLFSAACLSTGLRMSRVLVAPGAPVAERMVLSFALGVFTFFVGMVVVGLLRGYGPWFALGWPLAMVAVGARPLGRTLLRLARKTRPLRARGALALPLSRLPVVALGLLGVLMLYLLVLTPDNISYDAAWYHLAIAEHYAAYGGIERFHEGWFQGTNPHLGSLLYTWGFILPWTRVIDRALLCAHLEFLLFVWTLAGIPPLVRRLLYGTREPLAWVATFLFPGILLYDSNLSVGADHVGAFWAPPIALALLRVWRKPDPRSLTLLGVFICGALLTKYTVVVLAVAPIFAALGRALWVGAVGLGRKTAGGMRDAWFGLAAFAATGVIATAPHWLKNLLWHGDPLYPILYKHTHPDPWTVDSAAYYGIGIRDRLLGPKGTVWERGWDTVQTIFTFAFEPHNWARFHGDVPVFGFLFTVGSVLLLALPRTRRVWGLVLCTWVGLAVWYSIHPRDRYLQSILPWMVAVVAAALVLAWQGNRLHKGLALGLVGVQLVWGGDVYFIRTHAMAKDAPIKAVATFLAKGFEKKYEERLHAFGMMEKMGDSLPSGAKVLVHEEHLHLGLQARSVNDWPGYQGGLVYGRIASPRALHHQLVAWGVTHVAWVHQRSREAEGLAGDLLFFEYVTFYLGDSAAFGSWRLGTLGAPPPSERTHGDVVAVLGCGNDYQSGLYDRQSMVVPGGQREPSAYPTPQRRLGDNGLTAQEMIGVAQYVVWDPKCQDGVDRGWLESFEKVAKRGPAELWVRRAGQ